MLVVDHVKPDWLNGQARPVNCWAGGLRWTTSAFISGSAPTRLEVKRWYGNPRLTVIPQSMQMSQLFVADEDLIEPIDDLQDSLVLHEWQFIPPLKHVGFLAQIRSKVSLLGCTGVMLAGSVIRADDYCEGRR
ncbi:MAG: hypothetical protein ABSA50_09760 [Candidatus Bathyarchaeia archaeon]